MQLPRIFLRPFSSALACVYFATNCAFLHATETNFWAQRRALAMALPTVQPSLSANTDSFLSSEKTGFPVKSSDNSIVAYLPFQYGSVRKIVRPVGGGNGRVVIHIQDIHRNAEAQANIGRALQELIDKKSVDMVALEGAFGPMDFSWYRNFPDQGAVKAVANYLFKEKRISGPVYAALRLRSGQALPAFVGVDDKQHYDANVQAYRDSIAQSAAAKEMLRRQTNELALAKNKIFDGQLKNFDDQVQAYRQGTLSWANYVRCLAKNATDISPHIVAYLTALKMEQTLDFTQVEQQRAELINLLLRKLNSYENRDILNLSVAYRAGAIGHAEFYTRLQEFCSHKGVALSKFPAMTKYLHYVLLSENLDVDGILADSVALEQKIYDVLAQTDEQKKVIKASRRLYLTGKLLDFSLTKGEWEEYQSRVYGPWTMDHRPNFSPFVKFYWEAEARDRAMAENLERAMDASRAKVVVLVTGGFHSDGLARQLQPKGISVISYAPKITKVEDANGSSYLSVFAQEKTPLDKLFAGEKLFLASAPATDPAITERIVSLTSDGFARGQEKITGKDIEVQLDLPRRQLLSVGLTALALSQLAVDGQGSLLAYKETIAPKVRPFKSQDTKAVRAIALETAYHGGPYQAFFQTPEWLADYLITPYVLLEPEHLYVAEVDGRVVGYLTGVFDSASFSRKKIFGFYPKLLWSFFKNGVLLSPTNWKFLVHFLIGKFTEKITHQKIDGVTGKPSNIADYSAHMHINIRDGFRGSGFGHQLFDAFVRDARSAGVRGIHLHTLRPEDRHPYFESVNFEKLESCLFSGFAYLGEPRLHYITYGMKLRDALEQNIEAPVGLLDVGLSGIVLFAMVDFLVPLAFFLTCSGVIFLLLAGAFIVFRVKKRWVALELLIASTFLGLAFWSYSAATPERGVTIGRRTLLDAADIIQEIHVIKPFIVSAAVGDPRSLTKEAQDLLSKNEWTEDETKRAIALDGPFMRGETIHLSVETSNKFTDRIFRWRGFYEVRNSLPALISDQQHWTLNDCATVRRALANFPDQFTSEETNALQERLALFENTVFSWNNLEAAKKKWRLLKDSGQLHDRQKPQLIWRGDLNRKQFVQVMSYKGHLVVALGAAHNNPKTIEIAKWMGAQMESDPQHASLLIEEMVGEKNVAKINLQVVKGTEFEFLLGGAEKGKIPVGKSPNFMSASVVDRLIKNSPKDQDAVRTYAYFTAYDMVRTEQGKTNFLEELGEEGRSMFAVMRALDVTAATLNLDPKTLADSVFSTLDKTWTVDNIGTAAKSVDELLDSLCSLALDQLVVDLGELIDRNPNRETVYLYAGAAHLDKSYIPPTTLPLPHLQLLLKEHADMKLSPDEIEAFLKLIRQSRERIRRENIEKGANTNIEAILGQTPLSLNIAALDGRVAMRDTNDSALTAVVVDETLWTQFETQGMWGILSTEFRIHPDRQLLLIATSRSLQVRVQTKLKELSLPTMACAVLLKETWTQSDSSGAVHLAPTVLRDLMELIERRGAVGSMRFVLSKPPTVDLTDVPMMAVQLILLDGMSASVVGLDRLIESAKRALRNA